MTILIICGLIIFKLLSDILAMKVHNLLHYIYIYAIYLCAWSES